MKIYAREGMTNLLMTEVHMRKDIVLWSKRSHITVVLSFFLNFLFIFCVHLPLIINLPQSHLLVVIEPYVHCVKNKMVCTG